MHEFGIVQSLTNALLDQIKVEQITRVDEIHFRRGSAFSEDALRQAFAALSVGTPLENAKMVIETINLDHKCVCGHQQIITSDDLIGHMFVCPVCGTIREVDEAHDLELTQIVVAVNDAVKES
jgi:Zn finger protein HypA/HybF involved in hydrogenase expression